MSARSAVIVGPLVTQLLRAAFEQEAGYPPVADAVRGLTAEQAAWKPAPQRHSIWQIVRHLALWKEYALEEWDRRRPDPDAFVRRDWQEASGGADAWDADVRRLIEVSKQLIGRAASATDETLLAPLPQRGGQSLAFALLDLAAHDAYHAGQIRHLRALQGV